MTRTNIYKVGLLVLSQSPHRMLEDKMYKILPDNVELITVGACDALTSYQIDEMRPDSASTSDIFYTRFPNGKAAIISRRKAMKQLRINARRLETEGVDFAIMACTGVYPEELEGFSPPTLLPSDILRGLAFSFSVGTLVVMCPLESQIEMSKRKWADYPGDVTILPLRPDADNQTIDKATIKITELNPSLVVLDCFSFSQELRTRLIRDDNLCPSLMAMTVTSHVVTEMVS